MFSYIKNLLNRPFKPAPPVNIYQTLCDGDVERLSTIVTSQQIPFDINDVYKWNEQQNYNAFQLVCSVIHEKIITGEVEDPADLEKYINCCKLLLDNGIDIKYRDPTHNSEAIEFALFTGVSEIVKMTLDKYQEENISLAHRDLLTTILNFHHVDRIEENYIDMLSILIDGGLDVNMFDYELGVPPIYLAAKLKFKEAIELFCKKKIYEIDFDFFEDRQGKSARYLISKSSLYNGYIPRKKALNYFEIHSAIFDNNMNSFLTEYNYFQKDFNNDRKISFLFRTLNFGNEEMVEFMIEETKEIFNYYDILLEIACKRGFYKIVQILVETLQVPYELDLLRKLARTKEDPPDILDEKDKEKQKPINYDKCLEILLKNKKLELNQPDHNQELILEIAIRNNHNQMIIHLLNYGASLMKYSDVYPVGECLVNDIEPYILEKHFDYCIRHTPIPTTGEEDEKPDHDHIDYMIDFSSLLSPKNKYPFQTKSTDKTKNIHYTPELEVIEEISQNPDYQYLLKHPYIALITALKWSQAKWVIYAYISIYILFTVVLNFYLVFTSTELTETHHFWSKILILASFGIMVIIFLAMIIWNIAQFVVFKLASFYDIEGWLNLLTMLLTAFFIIEFFLKDKYPDVLAVHKPVGAVTALVSITNMFFLMKAFSFLSIYVIMIKTIYYIILVSLLQYAELVLGFAVCFHILFYDLYPKYFTSYYLSICKTLMMIIKDYDSTNLGLQELAFPSLPHLMMLLYAMTMSLGLLNLIIGQAVNDINRIKSQAELYGEIMKIENLSTLEKFFVKRKSKFHKIKRLICLFSFLEGKVSVGIDAEKRKAHIFGDRYIKVTINENLVNMIEATARKKTIEQ